MPGPARPRPPAAPRACVVTGAGGLPLGLDPARAALALKPARLARMDRLCALALVAADAALADAGLSLLSLASLGAERVGVVVGTRFGCHATNEEYFLGLLAEGPRGASPRLFAYTLPSSPLGEVALHFAARGPSQTVTAGRHAGVEAVARALSLCAAARADLVIAVAVELGGGVLVGDSCRDGATAIVIEPAAEAGAMGRRARARLAGAGQAFVAGEPTEARTVATARALSDAGLPARPLSPLRLPTDQGDQGATRATGALVDWLIGAPAEGEVCLLLEDDEAGGAAALLGVGCAATR